MIFQLVDLDENHFVQTIQIWENGWHETHSPIAPKELVALRTSESFVSRLRDNMENARIGVNGGDVLGLCMTRDNELFQLYVSPKAHGQGLAQALLADAEIRLLDAGHEVAWLSCAVGNERAARFYEKSGWKNVGIRTMNLDETQGISPFQVWRFEKRLTSNVEAIFSDS